MTRLFRSTLILLLSLENVGQEESEIILRKLSFHQDKRNHKSQPWKCGGQKKNSNKISLIDFGHWGKLLQVQELTCSHHNCARGTSYNEGPKISQRISFRHIWPRTFVVAAKEGRQNEEECRKKFK